MTQAPEEAAKEGDAPPDRVLAPVLGLTLADRSPTDAEAPAERQAGDHAAEAAPEPVALTPAAEAAPESIALTPAAEAAGMAAGAAVAANVVRFRPLQAIGLSRHAAGAEAGADRRSLAAGSDRETPADGVEATTGALLGTESSDTMALGGSLSPSELSAFAEIARTLAAPQAEAPGAAARRPIREVRSVASLPVPAQDPDEATAQEDSAPVAEASPEARVAPVPEGAADREGALVARHAAAVLDLLPEPLMISRGSALLFANRGLLALLGYADVAEWRAADQVLPRAAPETAMTGDAPIDIALRHRDGSAVPVTARRRPLLPEDPEGPTVLWTLAQPLPPSQISPSQISPAPDPSAAWAGDHKPMPGLLDLAGEAFVILDEGGRIEALNRRALDWFAGQRKPPLGLNFTSLLASESRATAVAMLADAQAAAGRADHEPVAREVQARTADGRIMPMRLTMACPAPGRVHVALHDLSDLKRAEQEVVRAKREAERASGRQPEFLAKVSHEIRTPLNAILGFAEVMMDERFGPLGNARYKDYLKDIHDSGTQVMSLVNDLLDLSQIEAGRLEIALDAIDVNKVILDCVAAMQPQAHRERVIMRTSLGARLPRILADDRTVRQIVTNLLSNAVKFNEPGGQVIVSTAINDGHGIAVRIRDTGIGMSDSDIAAALEPFRQLASSKTVSGTGLGLPLTKALIGANGATLSIRSRPKEGTFVEVVFAAAVEAVVAAPARVTG
jgi:signal transduction histidine kinase